MSKSNRFQQSVSIWRYAFWTQVLIIFNVLYFGWGKADNHQDNLNKHNPYATKYGKFLALVDKHRYR